MKKISMWSADYTQLTGQALVTARVRKHQTSFSWVEYIYSGAGWRSALTWLLATVRLWRDILFGRTKTIYLVCSRSNGGFVRDIPALLAARAGVRVIVHAHGSDIVELLSSRWISPLAMALYRHCEIIVPSTHLVKSLGNIADVRTHLCENYFGSEVVPKTPSTVDRNLLTILWNSNVMASKGFFDLAEAVGQLFEKGCRVRLISLGQPVGDSEMTRQQAAHRLNGLRKSEWFDYRGSVNQAEAIALTDEADVICLPSRYSSESQGIAIIEGMCAGKAIVASDIPALRATLREYPASFVPVCSVGAIVKALYDLQCLKKEDPIAFLVGRKEAAAVARERFDVKRFDREIEAILNKSSSPKR